MTRNIWIISDTHFGHANIINFCNRPFKDVNEMNDALLANWNDTVKDEDIIYHLGDVYFGKESQSLLYNLKGRKRLVLGNHDNGKDQVLQKVFEKIMVWRMFPEFGLLLTHVPVHESALERRETKLKWDNDKQDFIASEKITHLINIHGHIHQNKSPAGKFQNVCVEWINYKPINIDELRIK